MNLCFCMNFLIATRWLLLLLARRSSVLNTSVLCLMFSRMIKGYSLPGLLPSELVKLPYLQEM